MCAYEYYDFVESDFFSFPKWELSIICIDDNLNFDLSSQKKRRKNSSNFINIFEYLRQWLNRIRCYQNWSRQIVWSMRDCFLGTACGIQWAKTVGVSEMKMKCCAQGKEDGWGEREREREREKETKIMYKSSKRMAYFGFCIWIPHS